MHGAWYKNLVETFQVNFKPINNKNKGRRNAMAMAVAASFMNLS